MTGEPVAPSDDPSERADGRDGPEGLTERPTPAPLAIPRDEARLFEVLTAYLQAVESGEAPGRRRVAGEPSRARRRARSVSRRGRSSASR